MQIAMLFGVVLGCRRIPKGVPAEGGVLACDHTLPTHFLDVRDSEDRHVYSR